MSNTISMSSATRSKPPPALNGVRPKSAWPMVIEPAFDRVADPIERIFAVLDVYRRLLISTGCKEGCPWDMSRMAWSSSSGSESLMI